MAVLLNVHTQKNLSLLSFKCDFKAYLDEKCIYYFLLFLVCNSETLKKCILEMFLFLMFTNISYAFSYLLFKLYIKFLILMTF